MTNIIATSLMLGQYDNIPVAVLSCLIIGAVVGAVNGILIAVLRVAPPVQKPTSCAFGGPDLTMLYVTSVVWDLPPEALVNQPDACAAAYPSSPMKHQRLLEPSYEDYWNSVSCGQRGDEKLDLRSRRHGSTGSVWLGRGDARVENPCCGGRRRR
jgi:hypothetical protein